MVVSLSHSAVLYLTNISQEEVQDLHLPKSSILSPGHKWDGGTANIFFVKGPIVTISDFAEHMLSVTVTVLTAQKQLEERHGRAPEELNLQNGW